MFETLSALAVLGFATGTIGFVVSTISKVEEKWQEMRECEDRLRSFNWDLKEVVLALEAWRWIWIGRKGFSLGTYKHFWGHDGVQDIQARVDGIIELSNDIRLLLRQPLSNETGQSLPGSELRDWHQLIDTDVKHPSWQLHASNRQLSLVSKVGFTLFRNTSLSEKITRLKRHVEGLRDTSLQMLRLRQEGDPNSEVSPQELLHISRLKAFVDQISYIGDSIYVNMSQMSRLECAIELGPPLTGYDLDLWSEMDIFYIDFVLSDTTELEPGNSRVRIHGFDPGSLPQTIEKIGDLILRQRCVARSEHYRSFELLEKPLRLSRPLRNLLAEGTFRGRHRKSFKVDNAELVYSLGHWMISLWNTPWFSDLCTCGIRWTDLPDARKRHSFIACSQCHHSHPPSRVSHRSQLLGVVLAEIALGQPIRVYGRGEHYEIYRGELLSPKELLSILRRECGSTTITKAVSYCLETDPVGLGESLRPDHLELYFQEIILPLKKYYETVSKHYQSPSGRRFRDNANITSWYDSDTE